MYSSRKHHSPPPEGHIPHQVFRPVILASPDGQYNKDIHWPILHPNGFLILSSIHTAFFATSARPGYVQFSSLVLRDRSTNALMRHTPNDQTPEAETIISAHARRCRSYVAFSRPWSSTLGCIRATRYSSRARVRSHAPIDMPFATLIAHSPFRKIHQRFKGTMCFKFFRDVNKNPWTWDILGSEEEIWSSQLYTCVNSDYIRWRLD